MTRKYDLIIFGATGVTGEYVVEEIVQLIKPGSSTKPFTWAVAGRSERKLIESLRTVSDLTGIDVSYVDKIVADVSGMESLRQMAAKATVVLNVVGPFWFFGENVVKACIAEGTHYVDVSGELPFSEKMHALYHKESRAKGVHIVGPCGYGSVPADSGVAYLKEKFEGGEVNSVVSYATLNSEGTEKSSLFHYSTWQSIINALANTGLVKTYHQQMYTNPLPEPKHPAAARFPLHYSEEVKGWCMPYPGADPAIVHRSQYFFFHEGKQRPVQYNAYMKYPNLLVCFGISLILIIAMLFSQLKFTRNLLLKYPKLFSLDIISHESPTRAQLEKIKFSFTMIASGWKDKLTEPTDEHVEAPNKKLKLVITGTNPGYRSAAIILIQTALTILQEKEKLPRLGGVYTPGYAFAKTTLVPRLNARGVKFVVSEVQ